MGLEALVCEDRRPLVFVSADDHRVAGLAATMFGRDGDQILIQRIGESREGWRWKAR